MTYETCDRDWPACTTGSVSLHQYVSRDAHAHATPEATTQPSIPTECRAKAAACHTDTMSHTRTFNSLLEHARTPNQPIPPSYSPSPSHTPSHLHKYIGSYNVCYPPATYSPRSILNIKHMKHIRVLVLVSIRLRLTWLTPQ